MRPQYIIKLDKVQKTYQMGGESLHALRDISLVVEFGEFLAIMGTSGSGKSTLLNILGCLDRPTSGRYFVENRDVALMDQNELSKLRLRRFGFVFQNFNLVPQLDVQENIGLPLHYLDAGKSYNIKRVAELAELVGLSDRLRHRPMELSGGQQQRVAIARALANNPEIILADEPTGNLDSESSSQVLQILCELNQQGKTIILVTHDQVIGATAQKQLHIADGSIERIMHKDEKPS